jgi:hypothetical protein
MSTDINIGKKIAILDEGSSITTDVSQINFTGTGITATAVGNNVTVNVTGSSGVWGISNASGVYTYYATLTLAMAAATAGQVIELFADVTDTSAVTLKNGVSIQGNGHTYTYSGNTGNVFATPAGSGTYTFVNMNIKRANTATSTGAIFYGGSGFNSFPIFKFSSVNVTYTTTSGTAPISATDGSSRITFDGINVIGNSSGYLFDSSYIIIAIKNSIIENIGTGGCITTANYGARISFENLYLKTVSGTGIFMNYANDVIINSTGESSTGVVFSGQSGATAYDCFAFSNTSSAFSGLVCYNCTGHTITGSAFSSGSSLYNCAGRSSSTGYAVGIGFGGTRAFNSSFYSIQSIPVYGLDYGAYIYNCSVICDYNNAAGHGVSCGPSSGNPAFVNNYIQVFNTSANCIRGTNPFTGVVTNCVFKGATTPINANVTLSAVTINTTYNNITI